MPLTLSDSKRISSQIVVLNFRNGIASKKKKKNIYKTNKKILVIWGLYIMLFLH